MAWQMICEKLDDGMLLLAWLFEAVGGDVTVGFALFGFAVGESGSIVVARTDGRAQQDRDMVLFGDR